MKKKPVLIGIALICLVFTVACSSVADRVNAEPEKPYSVYDYVDSDGCQYLVVYSEKIVGGQGVGVGITQKVNQPESCSR